MTAAQRRIAQVAGFCLLLAAAAALYVLPRRPHPAEVVVYIGPGVGGRPYCGLGNAPRAYREGERDALRRLARELDLHPNVDRFVIRRGPGWEMWLDLDEVERAWTKYDRKSGHLQDFMMGSNCNGEWVNVTDDAVRGVARASGTFDGLQRYGCRKVCP